MLKIPLHALYTMVAVMGLLVTATASRLVIAANNPGRDFTELRQRVQSWWWMIGLLFAFLWIGQKASIFFFGFLSFLALKEFFSIIPTRHSDRRILFWAYISIPFQYYLVAIGWYGLFLVFIPVYLFLFLPMRMVTIGDTNGFIRSAGIIHWGVMLTVFCISHLAYLLTLPIKNTSAGPIGCVLFLLLLTQFNDVCQYVWGKLLGKNKILPKVSPNKTWEGFLGGVICVTVVAGLIAPLLTPLDSKLGLIAGLIISISGFFGDVVISSVKRDLYIKDCSQLIPGHGGILDRLDSLTYTAPLFFHFLYYVAF